MPHHKLTQVSVDNGCDATFAEYSRLSLRGANLKFSYELQGFVKWQMKAYEFSLPEACARVLQLVELLMKANDQIPPGDHA